MKEQKSYKTRQRSRVLECLVRNSDRHMTAEEIFEELKTTNTEIGKSTVYRTLEKLIEEGKARKYFSDEGKSACYQYIDENGSCASHFHLKCTRCGRLIHLKCDYLTDVEKHVYERHRFTVDNTKTVLYGVCEDCGGE
ncbi:MAG: transcriptional repressor [Bacteroides sp.]|nr:transcriptional repressor [Bacteroides sp.]